MAETNTDTTRATNDAYTGMLIISLLALIAGAVLLYLDFRQYPTSPAPVLKAPPPVSEEPEEKKAP